MNATARNYLPSANVDDGNCEAVIVGCKLSFAFNSNPAANTQLGEDGGCVAVVEGCTSTYAMCAAGSNDAGCFDPDANTDDGTCVINRCDDVMQAACDVNALCFPLLGGGSECVCLPNWNGPGTRCVPEIVGCTVGPTCNATDMTVSADVSSCAAVDVGGAAAAAKLACAAVGVCAFYPGAVNYDAPADTEEEPSTCYYNPCDIGTVSCPVEATCVFTGPTPLRASAPLASFGMASTASRIRLRVAQTNQRSTIIRPQISMMDRASRLCWDAWMRPITTTTRMQMWTMAAAFDGSSGALITRRSTKKTTIQTPTLSSVCALIVSPAARTRWRPTSWQLPTRMMMAAATSIHACNTAEDDCPALSMCVHEAGQSGHSCVCSTGFVGDGRTCEIEIPGCTDQNAINYNSYANTDNSACIYYCNAQDCSSIGALGSVACTTGWTGANCTINIDDCAGAPCQNSASCVDAINTYTCACEPGYSGTDCEFDTDECAAQPCLNAGACTKSIGSFTCTCVTGYSGNTCSECQSGGQSAETASVITARLTSSLATVDIPVGGTARDLATTAPALSTCIKIFQRVVRNGDSLTPRAALGTDGTCEFRTGDIVRVSVGENGAIYPNEDFILQPCQVWKVYADTVAGPIEHALWGTVAILAPADPVLPAAVIIGPGSLGPCAESIELDGSTSSGGGSSSLSLITEWA